MIVLILVFLGIAIFFFGLAIIHRGLSPLRRVHRPSFSGEEKASKPS